MSRSTRLRSLAVALLVAGAALPAAAQTRTGAAPRTVEVELDRYRLAINDIQRPNDASADRFSAVPFVGSGLVAGRLSVDLPFERWGTGHRIGLAWAPLTAEGSAAPATALRYQGSTFAAGVPLDVRYRFDTWRFTYSVPLIEPDAAGTGWSLRAGGTLAIRDAEIRLSQAGRTESFTNVGPVPLLHVSARRELGAGWSFEGAFDAFPAPGGGGLFDGTARIGLRLTPSLMVAAGIRHLEGGASGSELYTYVRATSATLTLRASF